MNARNAGNSFGKKVFKFLRGVLILLLLIGITFSVVYFGGRALIKRIVQTPNDPNDAVYSPLTGFIIDTKEPAAEAPELSPVVFETDSVRAEAAEAETEVEEEEELDLIEISTGADPLIGINDPNAVPEAKLDTEHCLLLSSDAGWFEVGPVHVDADSGYMAYLCNFSQDTVDVKVYTGFNEDDTGRFNVSSVLFQVFNLKGMREHTLGKNYTEQKTLVYGKIWDGSQLLDDPDLNGMTKMANPDVKIGITEKAAKIYEDLVVLGTDQTIPSIGIYDGKNFPAVILEPNQGLWSSSDKGKFTVGENKPIVSDYGYTLWLYNDSDQSVTVIFETGWNSSQKTPRWNVSIVVFSQADPASLAEYAVEKGKDEVKLNNYEYIWDGQNLILQNQN